MSEQLTKVVRKESLEGVQVDKLCHIKKHPIEEVNLGFLLFPNYQIISCLNSLTPGAFLNNITLL